MRTLFAAILTTAAITAQSPLTTTFANNNGGALGGAVYFELECLDPAGVFITSIELNFGNASTGGTVELYLKDGSDDPHTSPDWVGPVSTGTVTTLNPAGTPTTVDLAPSFQLGAGCKVGVALVCSSGLQHAYTTATTLPTTYSTAELELTVGGGSNVPFSGSLFSPRLVNISIPYTSGGTCPSIATVYPQGDGCGGAAVYASFYELFSPASSTDLDGQEIVATPKVGGGFDITLQAGTINPVGSLDPAAVPLVLGDDVSVAVGSYGVEVFSNNQVAFGPGNSTNWSPTVTAMLSNPSTAIYCWSDHSPNLSGSGPVVYEEDASGQVQVTYDGVFMFGTTDPTTVQYRIDTVGGGWTLSIGTLAPTSPEDYLIGYSIGGASADPGNTDITATAPFSIEAADDVTPNLALTASNRPIQGNSPVPFDVTTENIPAGALSHIGIFGLSRPNLPLDSLGLPGCFLHASLDVLMFEVLPAGTTSHTWTAVTLPASGPFRRVYNFDLQSVVFGTSVNNYLGLGAITSNGLKCKTGKL
ncbi:MAG TPA: hypothetical protein ENI87_13525 [bacterium]|nr:hypothetical protein [bacterium]